MSWPSVRTITARLLLVVLLGVIVPLGLTGVWLTRASGRAGRTLLRSQLAAGASRLTTVASMRMATREGELQLLANNSIAAELMASDSTSPEAQAYLRQLVDALSPGVFSVEYVDAERRIRWPEPRNFTDTNFDVPRVAFEPSVLHERPVMREGSVVGTVRARVRLATLVPLDSVAMLASGASLMVRDSSGLVLWRSPELTSEEGLNEKLEWEVVSGSLPSQRLMFELMAPSAPFVAPFEEAARTGLGVLGVVAVLALLVSVVFVRQASRSLRELSIVASAVTSGDLTQSVDVSGADEVADLARAFNRMVKSLRETLLELSRQRSLAAVGEYAASLSHEVRNGLTAVRVDLQHASHQFEHDAQAAALVQRALDSVRRLDGTVSSALRMARTGHVVRHSVSLLSVIDRACATTRHQFEERGARLQLVRPASSCQVEVDAAAIEQLAVNLLLNAAQALGPGGEARVSLEVRDTEVRVRVEDTGTGIDEAVRDQLGTPLSSTKPTGTGLGLPIARRIAEAHGGQLELESRPGEGTIAILTLPRSQSASV